MRSRTLVLFSALGCVAVATPARADDAANTATARALGIEGVTLADAGLCRDAIEKLERAEELHHAPTTAARLGECEIETGKLVVGTERLQRVVREPLEASAHPAFFAAVARAQKSLERALPRIPALRISVKAPPTAKLALTIDGEPAPGAILDTNRRIDPGSHRIEVRAAGFLRSAATVSVDEGETKDVVLELAPDPSAGAGADVAAERVLSGEASAPGRRSVVPAILAFGVGAVGLGLGIGAGSVVARKASALEDGCDASRVCSPERASEIRDAKTWATVSTVGFAAAGVGVITGVVLLLTSGGTSASRTGARVRPLVGVGSLGAEGVF